MKSEMKKEILFHITQKTLKNLKLIKHYKALIAKIEENQILIAQYMKISLLGEKLDYKYNQKMK